MQHLPGAVSLWLADEIKWTVSNSYPRRRKRMLPVVPNPNWNKMWMCINNFFSFNIYYFSVFLDCCLMIKLSFIDIHPLVYILSAKCLRCSSTYLSMRCNGIQEKKNTGCYRWMAVILWDVCLSLLNRCISLVCLCVWLHS